MSREPQKKAKPQEQRRSPWQLMIENAKDLYGMSYAEIAKTLGMRKSTLFAQVTSQTGAPPHHHYSRKENAAMARALKINAAELWAAYGQSISLANGNDTKDEDAKISKLRSMIQHWPKGTIPKAVLLDILD